MVGTEGQLGELGWDLERTLDTNAVTEDGVVAERGHHLDAAREGTLKGVPPFVRFFNPASVSPHVITQTNEATLPHTYVQTAPHAPARRKND